MSGFLRTFIKDCVKAVLIGVSIAVLVALLISLAFSVAKADAEVPFTVGVYSTLKAATCGTHFVPSATEATYVTGNLSQGVTSLQEIGLKLFVGKSGEEVEVGNSNLRASAGSLYHLNVSALVGPTQDVRFECTGPTTERSLTYSQASVKGGEGKEGKEGKEGPVGKEGPAGPEGKEGKAVGTKIESFGTTAESTLSEIVERIEVLVWCLLGAMLAAVLYMSVRDMLRLRKS